MSEVISGFFGQYRFLSNFWLVPVEYEGAVYPSVENAYQASKISNISSRSIFQEISPREAKKLGRSFLVKTSMAPSFDSTRLGIMKKLLQRKFEDPRLRDRLLYTGDSLLVEANTWGDSFWGVFNGVGENHLGNLLMEVRSEIKVNDD